jgi:hypothetical protein
MDLDADMVRNEAKDAFSVSRGNANAGIFQPASEAIDPEPPIGVEHHLDHARVFEMTRNRRPERGAQHARATSEGFRPKGDCRHTEPREFASRRRGCISGVD